MKTKNLHEAKKTKNDEFYTLYEDVEKELRHYHHHLEGKIIYCNADKDWSAFVNYFLENKDTIGYKELIYTHTDFRSPECVELLKEADIVVTNPPFSLFREYISLLVEHDKKFLVIGNSNAIITKEIFPLVQNNKVWLGTGNVSTFLQPDGSEKKFGNICWFTNLEHNKRNEEIILVREYNEDDYPKYDNYNAINVDKVKDIPVDYDGVMGVPISFFSRYNPNQFEIIWQASGNTRKCAPESVMSEVGYTKNKEDRGGCPVLNGKRVYTRILIRHKK